MPSMLPSLRCALTTPFHPYLRKGGGIFSVALAMDSRPPGVTWHLALRGPDFPLCGCTATARPTLCKHNIFRRNLFRISATQMEVVVAIIFLLGAASIQLSYTGESYSQVDDK